MLDAMRDATGVVGSTSVSVGAFIKTCGGSWDVPVDRIKMVDDRLFLMLKIEPKLAIIFGTETEAATHDQLFAFFKNLRNRRHEEVFKLMVAVNEKRSLDMNMTSRLVRKVLIDEISNSIDVEIEGFTSGYAVDGPIMVPPKIIKMLSALYHHDRPWIELNPDNIEFVRKGGSRALPKTSNGISNVEAPWTSPNTRTPSCTNRGSYTAGCETLTVR